MEILGIDIGGSGIKAAPVNLETGEFAAERHRIKTPQPSKPKAVAKVVGKLVKHFDYSGPIGCTFPAIVHHGVVKSAANVDDDWIGTDANALFSEVTGSPVKMLNDADAAGVAEMQIGAGKGRDGVVILLTLGTGIGTAIFVDGHLLPNTEFGHLQIRGKDAEHRASDKIRKDEDLSWKHWAKRLNEYLAQMEFFFSPRPLYHRRRGEQEAQKVFPLFEDQRRNFAGATAQSGGHYRRGHGGEGVEGVARGK